MTRFRLWEWATCLALLCAMQGCQVITIPNPNERLPGTHVEPEVISRNMDEVAAMLDLLVRRGEITPELRDQRLQEFADEMLNDIAIDRVPPERAWVWGDAFRRAKRWTEAYQLYSKAVEAAEGEDRRVNDRLRLAHAAAALGKVEEAIELARSTFDTPDEGAAPILMAVLYEIVPAGTGKGHDAALAKLLEDAIPHHMRVVVDPESVPGRTFLLARPAHVLRAWNQVARMYSEAGAVDEARSAVEKGEQMMRQFGTA